MHANIGILLTIFEQVYNFSFMLSDENLEKIVAQISTVEFNFRS